MGGGNNGSMGGESDPSVYGSMGGESDPSAYGERRKEDTHGYGGYDLMDGESNPMDNNPGHGSMGGESDPSDYGLPGSNPQVQNIFRDDDGKGQKAKNIIIQNFYRRLHAVHE